MAHNISLALWRGLSERPAVKKKRYGQAGNNKYFRHSANAASLAAIIDTLKLITLRDNLEKCANGKCPD